jgi:hypothetical protein
MPSTNTRNSSSSRHSGLSGYYPFGMQMQGRDFAGGMRYRWGFGSQECDNEVSGRGNSYTAEFWQYDSRLGRRWNLDPVIHSSISGFAVFLNNPINFSDHNGADTTRATKEAGAFLDNILWHQKEVPRTELGKLLTGQKTKVITNDNYSPEVARIIKDAAENKAIKLTVTTDASVVPGLNISGMMKKTGDNEYLIYFNPNADVSRIGISPFFEELFHFDNAISGTTEYTIKNDKWGVWDDQALLTDEAIAKHRVITHCSKIISSHWTYTNTFGGYAQIPTDFGYMMMNCPTIHDVKQFISIRPSQPYSAELQYQGIDRTSGNNDNLPKKHYYLINSQGAYQHLNNTH